MTVTLPQDLPALQAHARAVADLLRLPFRSRAWRGAQGNWQGVGSGNSLDFQDHRPYSPGDDPRHVNWQAYARTGSYVMKLYRQEASPAVDLAIDLSASMFVDAEKSRRTAELLYWAVESAEQAGAALRCYALDEAGAEPLAIETILGHSWVKPAGPPAAEAIRGVPWRYGSLRVYLSDLLWSGDTQAVFHALTENNGLGLILAPFSRGEAEPDWSGNIEMVDSETQEVRLQRIEPEALRRYLAAYQRHFAIWEEQAARRQVALARVAASLDLAEALRLQMPAVEWK